VLQLFIVVSLLLCLIHKLCIIRSRFTWEKTAKIKNAEITLIVPNNLIIDHYKVPESLLHCFYLSLTLQKE